MSSPNLDEVSSDPAIFAIGGPEIGPSGSVGSPPRIGDPGKRMLGAVLRMHHPGLGPRVIGQKLLSSGPSPVAVTTEVYMVCCPDLDGCERDVNLCPVSGLALQFLISSILRQ